MTLITIVLIIVNKKIIALALFQNLVFRYNDNHNAIMIEGIIQMENNIFQEVHLLMLQSQLDHNCKLIEHLH